MIPREILKKIRPIERRTNRIVTVSTVRGASRIPTGFQPKAQGCEERATLGCRSQGIPNRNAVVAYRNPDGVDENLIPFTQGSACVATLDYMPESLWDSSNAFNWLNFTADSLPKLNDWNPDAWNRRATAGAALADDRATCADDAASLADDPTTRADGAASFADGRANRADDRADLAPSAATCADGRDAGADDRAGFADVAATRANTPTIFADCRDRFAHNAATVAERHYRNAAAGISSAKRAFKSRSRQIYFSTP